MVAAAVVAAAIFELCAREIARRSVVAHLTGWDFSPWAIALVAAIAAAAVSIRALRRIAMLFGALFALGLAAQLSLGARLQGDGFYYFAYLRSVVFDGDVELSNDYRLLGLGDKPHLFQPTPTGHAQSAATVGPAILWAPFFAVGHVVAVYLSARDPNVTANGISFPYRQAVCVGSLCYGLFGCWFMYRLCALSYERRLAAAAVSLIVAGSFMLWYLVKEPSMTHATSMALVAGFAWMWAKTRERRSALQWCGLGALAGLMTLVRWQNALFTILPAWDAARLLAEAWRRSDRRAVIEVLKNGLLFTAAATLIFVPQLAAWRAIYGTWFAVSPLGPQINFADPRISDILWSSRNGLLSTSPVLYVSALGLIGVAWVRPALGVPALLAVALMTYFNACIQDWWGSSSFGGRRFDGIVPFFCLGLAQALAASIAFLRRHPTALLWTGGAYAVLWNLSLMAATNAGNVRIGEPASFGDIMAAQARTIHQWFGNPFTYPASLFFALRNDISPARYDLLSVNQFLGDRRRPYGRIDIGSGDDWTLEGAWHQPEQEGATSFRWAMSQATVLIPLHHRADLRVQIRLHAFGFAGAPDQTLTVVVNGHPHGPVPVSSGWHTLELMVNRAEWRSGVNRLSLEFAWERRPSDVGLGGDTRPLAAALDYIRVSVPEP